MLTVHHISKTFGINRILHNISFSVNPGEIVGLIGPNGCGKTTLAKIITGDVLPDEGHVSLNPADLKVGYLAQGFELDKTQTIGSLIDRLLGQEASIEDQLYRLSLRIATDPSDPYLQTKYDQLVRYFENPNRTDPGKTLNIFKHLGLLDLPKELALGKLSGGQKTRLGLALILLDDPDFLILDEPTNHLDLTMLEWLEGWVRSFDGGALIISHDRMFLENTVTRILDLDPETQQVQSYAGTYNDYLDQYLMEQNKQMDAYKDQVYEIRRIQQDINRLKNQALGTERSTNNDQLRRYAKKVAKKATGRKKKLERYLDSEERLEKPKEGWQVKIDFNLPGHMSKDVLRIEALSVGYEPNHPLVEEINEYILSGERIILTGPNGCGKTTLLKTILRTIDPLSGTIHYGHNIKIGYLEQESGLKLESGSNALQTIQEATGWNQTETRSFLHYFLFADDDPLRPLDRLSYGERTRLALARIVATGANFLILDEPTNHLDIPSRELFERALSGFQGTILAVIHDRFFIDRFATSVWDIHENRLSRSIYRIS